MRTRARILDVYTRVSHKSDKRALSTAGQEARCRARVDNAGAQLGAVFSDPARSAWNPSVARPGWDALMARLESGASDGVVVFDLPRFARRRADGERLIQAAERGLSILDDGSEYNLTTASGKKSFADQISAAAYYSDLISESSQRGKAFKAQNGEVDHRRSFGFEQDGVTIREEEASIIRDHAQRLLAGETQNSLINELNDAGVPSVRGARWTYTTYRQVMTRQRNIGLILYKGQPVAKLPGTPILDDATYHRIVVLYAKRKPGKPPSGRYVLTGIVVCGVCGSDLGGQPVTGTDRRRYWCRYCRKIFVDAGRLDEWAGDYAIRILSDQEQVDALERASAEIKASRARLLAESDSIEQDLIEMAERAGRREISLAVRDAYCRGSEARQRAIHDELAALADAEPEPLPPGVRTISAHGAAWVGWLEQWTEGSTAVQRTMVLRALNGKKIAVARAGRSARRFDPGRVTVR